MRIVDVASPSRCKAEVNIQDLLYRRTRLSCCVEKETETDTMNLGISELSPFQIPAGTFIKHRTNIG